jgi:hypothetical protein
LRRFFKECGLARREVSVALCERKHEAITVVCGQQFLYGTPVAGGFPVALYLHKWERRAVEEPDDGQAAPPVGRAFAGRGSNRV